MLQLVIPEMELYDDATNTFTTTKKEYLQLEHSLVSISKWEAKWGKAFLSKEPKTTEETIDYVKCMTINQNVNPDIYLRLPADIHAQIDSYINAKMTATCFSKTPDQPPSREVVTSELIYYWMIAHGIPFECQKWHLNRLVTLIKVCDLKSKPPKKQGRKEMLSERAALNAARKAKLNTNG